jgi:hypothetical protein
MLIFISIFLGTKLRGKKHTEESVRCRTELAVLKIPPKNKNYVSFCRQMTAKGMPFGTSLIGTRSVVLRSLVLNAERL